VKVLITLTPYAEALHLRLIHKNMHAKANGIEQNRHT